MDLQVSESELPIKKFEESLCVALEEMHLPSEGILVSVSQRRNVFKNLGEVIEPIPVEKRKESVYISKFVAAAAAGLFDAALNYLWDETIQELRKRAILYDVEYLYDNCVPEEKRKKLSGPEDIVRIDDAELIQGCKSISLISELGYKHLDYIRYMRNWASAAHPNQNQITGLQLVTWLQTCIDEVISLPLSNNAIEIKKLLGNLRKNEIDEKQAIQISQFFMELPQIDANNLALGFFGMYCHDDSKQGIVDNVNLLAPKLWPFVDEDTRCAIGVKYAQFLANNQQPKQAKAREFLEIVEGLSYLPDGIRAAEIETAIDNLISAHRRVGNFYNEPAFARELKRIVGDSGSIPKQIEKKFVLALTEAYITNGNGVAWNAEPYYEEMIKGFKKTSAMRCLISFQSEPISVRLGYSLCARKFRDLISIISPKLTAPAAKEIAQAIIEYGDHLQGLRTDSRIIRKVDNMIKIIG